MEIETALTLADTVIFTRTGKHLNDLQTTIFRQVWQGKKYLEIADFYGCTEGHVKDIAYLFWKLLSEAFGEKVTKTNFRTVFKRHLQSEQTFLAANLTSDTSNFVGRENAIARLDTLIERGNKVIIVRGEGGIGKTTLAQQYLQSKGFELILEFLMAKESQNILSVESVVEEWLKRDFNEEPGREFGVSLGRLKRHLEARKIGLLIDNLEPALDRFGKFIAFHRRYVELLRVLADVKVKSVTLITSRDRLCESDLTLCHYRLPGLDEKAWKIFFDFHRIVPHLSTLQTLHKIYGGNAKAMGIICGVIQEDFKGDINAYWRENEGDPLGKTDLKNLVSSQFDRLQTLDIDAYRLLCRLGCYRYQDIPTISTKGLLSLLWDVDDDKQKIIIESLKNRSLIEYSNGKYYLHPVIRAEAIHRLKTSGEWKIANSKAADFWTNSVNKIINSQDAITALEAYYHYVEIDDCDRAAQVILKSRDNQWGQFLPLGSTLYRMGLLQPVLTTITYIIDKVNSPYHLSELYNILGDLYWITGKIENAIASQEKTIDLATQCFHQLEPTSENKHTFYYFKMLEVDSMLSIGLYKIDLWELKEAANLFERVIEQTTNTVHYRWGQKASVCLGLVYSYLGLKQEALTYADRIYETIVSDGLLEHPGRFAYFMQILGQTYINLGEIEKSESMYRRAIAFSEESHYQQVKAKALMGLAEIDRKREAFEVAIVRHSEAIELLETIGAKCDLAEAYFQLGLTYQKMGSQKTQMNFETAMQLFTEINAPKQVEKIRIAN
ncbi:MAG: NB-ARC domain-containing protein [Hydrococcus sp. Prado102]|jgi:tetratricopeptide (TPR) repeat protein|nr:NB-ARC domain-containing protein [Hydrococcus sp. Prado102]